MVHNLPMIFATLRLWALVLLCLLTTTSAQAQRESKGLSAADTCGPTFTPLSGTPGASGLNLAGLHGTTWLMRRMLNQPQRPSPNGATGSPVARAHGDVVSVTWAKVFAYLPACSRAV